ncbi:EXTL2, alpha-1,4-N-acetylhexosaminyltransferase [Corchorus capsularis]|uniref:EXTL2, alpha-1,4-N-acetylhexosaminyltransferase n=1 Tax=Corchorus capsularis TaxID=210143 RepID=A0A1R3HJS0_COCAP|nr:EXTL2, alpha-1,4-N-acetylhexosaminyltransferase [Corchorus capsularis]
MGLKEGFRFRDLICKFGGYSVPVAASTEVIEGGENCEASLGFSFSKSKIFEIDSTGISSLGGHGDRRTRCVNKFVAEFGQMPLIRNNESAGHRPSRTNHKSSPKPKAQPLFLTFSFPTKCLLRNPSFTSNLPNLTSNPLNGDG